MKRLSKEGYFRKPLRCPPGRKTGFTFIEILIVITLILLVFCLTSPKLIRNFEHQTNARAAAMRLTEDLRYLRQRAISANIPTALVIPNENLTKGHCRGYITREGLAAYKKPNIVSFENLYRDISIFVGHWDIASSQLQDSALMPSSGPINAFSNNSGFSVDLWKGSKDYTFIFTPEGKVITNENMPHFDNAYHIVLGEYFACQPAALLPGATFNESSVLTSCYKLSSVWRPVYTVTITPAGEISFSEGVTALIQSAYSTSQPSSPGNGSGITGSITDLPGPRISKVIIYPEINRLMFPDSTGIDATVTPDGLLNIDVEGVDDDVDPLTLKMIAEGGTISHSGSVPMKYNPSGGVFHGELAWRPPQGAAVGTKYKLDISIKGEINTATTSKRVQIIERGKIAYYVSNNGFIDLRMANSDGTRLINFPKIAADSFIGPSPFLGFCGAPALSPDGTKIAFVSTKSGYPDIWVMNSDGCGLMNLTNSSVRESSPSWSPDGTKIAFHGEELSGTGWSTIYTMNADGSGRESLATGFWPHWSPDGNNIAFFRYVGPPREYELFLVCVDKSSGFYRNERNISNDWAFDCRYPRWSPGGSRIVFYSRDSNGQNDIYVMNPDGSNKIGLTNDPADDWDPCWSPDGAKIIFLSSRGGSTQPYIMDSNGQNQRKFFDVQGGFGSCSWSR